MTAQTIEHGQYTQLSANSYTRQGHSFLGWAMANNASTPDYADEAIITATGNVTLYAVWSVESYIITFNANGGNGYMNHQLIQPSVAVKLNKSTFRRTGYTFQGWATSPGATAPNYADEASFTASENITLYAVWLYGENLIVSSGNVITLSDGSVAYGTIVVEDDATLKVQDDITTHNLILKSGIRSYYNLILTESMQTNYLEFNKRINNAAWYFFSVPFDCTIADIEAANTHIGEYNSHWFIKEYSEAERAAANAYNTWQALPDNATLKAHKGYVISTGTSEYKEIKFPRHFTSPTKLTEGGNIPVVASTSGQKVDIGWNIVSVPYFKKGKYKAMFTANDGKTTELYVSLPINNELNNHSQMQSTQHEFSPSESFFIQVPSSGNVSFTPSVEGESYDYEAYIISFRDGTNAEIDRATLLLKPDAPSDEYEILYDLKKNAAYDNNPKVYFIDHNTRLSYSAINIDDYPTIPLGVYVPNAGSYTLNLRQPNTLGGEKGNLRLYDTQLNVYVNTDNYTFQVDAEGNIFGRFYLTDAPTSTDIIEDDGVVVSQRDGAIHIEGIDVGTAIRLYTADGKSISHHTADNTEFTIDQHQLPAGIYMLHVGERTHTLLVK